jgi:hypothetical protein
MNPKLTVTLGVLAGVAVGGAAGYYVATTRRGRRAIRAAEDVISKSDLRLPDPSYAVELPYTDENFQILDELVCECGEPVINAATQTSTIDDVTSQIQLCMARELYPDFAWPPVAGDHPTVSQLWAELAVVARRAVVTAEICPQPIPPIPQLPAPQPNPGAYRRW